MSRPLTPTNGATLTLAASNASDRSKASANYRCNGVTDAAQIRDAVSRVAATGGRVYLTEGTFNVNQTIEARGQVTIQGAGPLATKLLLINGANTNMIEWDATRDTEFFFVLRDLELNGNTDGNTAGVGLRAQNSAGKLLSDGRVGKRVHPALRFARCVCGISVGLDGPRRCDRAERRGWLVRGG